MGKQLVPARMKMDVTELSRLLSGFGDLYAGRRLTDAPLEELKKQIQNNGLEGLRKIQPHKKTHPRATPPEVVQMIIDLSLEHPGWGCIKLSRALKLLNRDISHPTIKNILIKHRLGDKAERIGWLEEKFLRQEIQLTPEQLRMVEKVNPCYRERFNESGRPGEMLVQDTFLVGDFKQIGKLYLQIVIDTFNSYAFCLLHQGKFADYAVVLLDSEVLPFYKQQGLEVTSILTDNGREYCGKEQHHYSIYLMLNDIEHRKLAKGEKQNNGFLQRFQQTVLNDFFQNRMVKGSSQGLGGIRQELKRWLDEYNQNEKLRGYRNLGCSPRQRLEEYLQSLNRQ